MVTEERIASFNGLTFVLAMLALRLSVGLCKGNVSGLQDATDIIQVFIQTDPVL